ncbi:MAG: haloalkane dehalogenase [Deltaproteobacteria bacterium]|nr:haloalkane dehalogenase [Deltaproteobacteria bacterium]
MKILRTPDDRFLNLPGYTFKPNYIDVPSGEEETLRIHYVDEGPKDANPVLLMHGEPSWSYLYRKMIPPIVNAGHRAVAPDLIGFGRSDKPADRTDYTYQRHVDWMKAWLKELNLREITLVCQDWGGLIGLRLLTDNPDRFARVVTANTGLPKGDPDLISQAFLDWRKFSQEVPEFDVGGIINFATVTSLSDEIIAAYNAPFPNETYKEGARIFPSLVPIDSNDPAVPANQKAWEVLSAFEKPFLTAFSDSDSITKGGELIFQNGVPGAKGQPHTTIKGGGHFLQEDCGEKFAAVVVDFISKIS